MSRRVLEINDLGLRVADAEGARVESPALIVSGEYRAGSGILIGAPADARRRINPRATHDRFWFALDDSPLPRPVGPARSHADLAWLHLQALLRELDSGRDADRPWTVVVPGEMNSSRLALLLGILASHDLRVDRLVPAPLAAAAAAAPQTHCAVLDVHRHFFSLVQVNYRQGTYQPESDPAPIGRGLGALMDGFAELVVEAFLAQARFDPSREAEIEQVLYDRLPGWLARLADEREVDAELPAGSHQYRAKLEPGRFIDAARSFYTPLRERLGELDSGALVVRDRCKGLPGLSQLLDEFGRSKPLWLEPDVLFERAFGLPPALSESGRDQGVPLMLSWPETGAIPARAAPARPVGPRPSHVLIDGRARKIVPGLVLADGWRLALNDDGGVRLDGEGPVEVRRNNQPVGAGTVLEVGDRIQVGSRDFVLLRVEGHGTA